MIFGVAKNYSFLLLAGNISINY